MYFHNAPNHIRLSVLNAIACIILRNFTNEEISENMNTELSEYWNQSPLNVPDSFLEDWYYDNFFNDLNSDSMVVDFANLEKRMDTDSFEFWRENKISEREDRKLGVPSYSEV